ncbi:MAG: DNA methyltransferase [Chthoniobacterales bacterium]
MLRVEASINETGEASIGEWAHLAHSLAGLHRELADFHAFGAKTAVTETSGGVPVYTNEFWTSKQRAAHALHEISYRACFKPQLPRFFIERLTQPGELVYDPFLGRGTTVLEAALLGRRAAGNDVNPLSRILAEPRLRPPSLEAIRERLAAVDWSAQSEEEPGTEDLLVFYHPGTLQELMALRIHLQKRVELQSNDAVDDWIRMVATNRLTGHSAGFFSIYTLPPNQAVSAARQRKINANRSQTPPRRDVAAIILKKSASLLRNGGVPERTSGRFFTGSAMAQSPLEVGSVSLVVTSPPFLNMVDYAGDNWLRCWFNGIDPGQLALTQSRLKVDWSAEMTLCFRELARVVRPGGAIAFEVGEIDRSRIQMEDLVIPAAAAAGLHPHLVLVNAQEFTKTANCWGVSNQTKGTNTNRVVLLGKT